MSDVQAAAPRPLPRPRPPDPETDRRLARLHLRMGLLSLARAELEALAGSDDLGDDGLEALAEARWRTGDLAGAGEAAQACLEAGAAPLVALVIAAEAVASVGRPGEARRLAAQALERAEMPLDTIFAGMPRSLIWPADPAEAGQPAGTLFPDAGVARPPATFEAAEAAAGEEATAVVAGEPGFWDAPDAGRDLPDGASALAAADAAIEAGSIGAAAVHLALVLRFSPQLAPAVLEATDRAAAAGAEPGAELELVRGDAYRLVGHETDARRAWAAAAAALRGTARPASAQPATAQPAGAQPASAHRQEEP